MRRNLLLVVCCVVPLMTMSQEHIDTVTGKTHRLTGVEVVASSETGKVTTTSPVQTIGTEQMLRLGIQNITDALKNIGGITIRDYGGAGGMKTVSVRGIGARHTAIAYDGIVLSDCQTGEIDLSRYSLDYVRLLSLTIGDGDNIFQPARNMAAAATLNIEVLQTPEEEAERNGDSQLPRNGAGRLSLGSWGMVSPAFHGGIRINKNTTVSATGTYTYAENDYPFTLRNNNTSTRERRKNSRMSSGHSEVNATWKDYNGNTLRGKVYYYDSNRQLPGIVHYYTNENDETLRERNLFAQAKYDTRLSDQWKLTASTKFNWAESRYHNGMPTAGIADSRYIQNETYGTATAMYEPTVNWALSYSADYIYNKLHNTAASLSGPDRHSILQALSVRYKLPRLTVIVRTLLSDYTDHGFWKKDKKNTNRLSPSFNASYRLLPNHDLYIRIMWKNIFRMPTFNELYYYHIGTTDLKPESNNQWNIGITWKSKTFNGWQATVTADGYVNDVKDKLVAIPFNMFVWRMMNLAKVKGRGIDLTTHIQRTLNGRHSIELTGNYSFQKIENRSNETSPYYKNQIAYIPEHTFCATVGWLNPWVNMSVSANGMSERWTVNEHADGTRLAGFAEMSFNVWRSFTPHLGSLGATHITLRGSIINILDKQYDIIAHYPMPGRSWRITAEISF